MGIGADCGVFLYVCFFVVAHTVILGLAVPGFGYYSTTLTSIDNVDQYTNGTLCALDKTCDDNVRFLKETSLPVFIGNTYAIVGCVATIFIFTIPVIFLMCKQCIEDAVVSSNTSRNTSVDTSSASSNSTIPDTVGVKVGIVYGGDYGAYSNTSSPNRPYSSVASSVASSHPPVTRSASFAQRYQFKRGRTFKDLKKDVSDSYPSLTASIVVSYGLMYLCILLAAGM